MSPLFVCLEGGELGAVRGDERVQGTQAVGDFLLLGFLRWNRKLNAEKVSRIDIQQAVAPRPASNELCEFSAMTIVLEQILIEPIDTFTLQLQANEYCGSCCFLKFVELIDATLLELFRVAFLASKIPALDVYVALVLRARDLLSELLCLINESPARSNTDRCDVFRSDFFGQPFGDVT